MTDWIIKGNWRCCGPHDTEWQGLCECPCHLLRIAEAERDRAEKWVLEQSFDATDRCLECRHSHAEYPGEPSHYPDCYVATLEGHDDAWPEALALAAYKLPVTNRVTCRKCLLRRAEPCDPDCPLTQIMEYTEDDDE